MFLTASFAVSQLAANPNPDKCVMTTPTPEMLALTPAAITALPLAPVVKSFNALTDCTSVPFPNSPGIVNPCTEGWYYLDGTPVPSDYGAAITIGGATWNRAVAGIPLVLANDVTGQLATPAAETEFSAVFVCCYIDEETCATFTEPVSAAPTPAPTKGKSRRRL